MHPNLKLRFAVGSTAALGALAVALAQPTPTPEPAGSFHRHSCPRLRPPLPITPPPCPARRRLPSPRRFPRQRQITRRRCPAQPHLPRPPRPLVRLTDRVRPPFRPTSIHRWRIPAPLPHPSPTSNAIQRTSPPEQGNHPQAQRGGDRQDPGFRGQPAQPCRAGHDAGPGD